MVVPSENEENYDDGEDEKIEYKRPSESMASFEKEKSSNDQLKEAAIAAGIYTEEELEKAKNEALNSVEALNKTITELTTAKETAESENATLVSDKTEMEAQNTALSGELTTANSKVAQLETDLTTAKTEAETLQTQVDALTAKLTEETTSREGSE